MKAINTVWLLITLLLGACCWAAIQSTHAQELNKDWNTSGVIYTPTASGTTSSIFAAVPEARVLAEIGEDGSVKWMAGVTEKDVTDYAKSGGLYGGLAIALWRAKIAAEKCQTPTIQQCAGFWTGRANGDSRKQLCGR